MQELRKVMTPAAELSDRLKTLLLEHPRAHSIAIAACEGVGSQAYAKAGALVALCVRCQCILCAAAARSALCYANLIWHRCQVGDVQGQHLVLHSMALVLHAVEDLTSGDITLEDVLEAKEYLQRFRECGEYMGACLHDLMPLAAPPVKQASHHRYPLLACAARVGW
jgi:hypothetical protein